MSPLSKYKRQQGVGRPQATDAQPIDQDIYSSDEAPPLPAQPNGAPGNPQMPAPGPNPYMGPQGAPQGLVDRLSQDQMQPNVARGGGTGAMFNGAAVDQGEGSIPQLGVMQGAPNMPPSRNMMPKQPSRLPTTRRSYM